MTIKISSFGGGGTVQLAPDLNFVSNKLGSTDIRSEITGIDGSSGYTTALSLTGKYIVNILEFDSLTNEQVDIRLTIDGVLVWDSGVVVSGGLLKLISNRASNLVTTEHLVCKSSLLLEVQTATDNNITLQFLVRPIL